MRKKANQWGGARDGAGAPKRDRPRVKVTLALEPEDASALRETARATGESQPGLVSRLINKERARLGRKNRPST